MSHISRGGRGARGGPRGPGALGGPRGPGARGGRDAPGSPRGRRTPAAGQATRNAQDARSSQGQSGKSQEASHAASYKSGENPRYVVYPESTPPYDYVAARSISRPTTVGESMVNMVKACLGGGILGIHVAFYKSGLYVAVVGTILIGLYITYCLHTLVSSAQKLYERLHITQMSYPDLAEAAFQTGAFPKLKKFSKPFRYLVDVTIMIDLFGSCCVYMIMIARTIVQLVKVWRGEPIVDVDSNPIPETKNDVRMYVAVVLLPILLICMIRSLKYLAPFSLLANIFIVITVITTIYYCMRSPTRLPLDQLSVFNTVGGFFEYCGVAVFAMESFGVALPLENNMKQPNKFSIALVGGYSVVVCFVTIVGFFGYLGWSSGAKAPVTLNLPATTFPTIIKALIGFMVYVTFAINFWAPFNLAWFYIQQKYNPEKFYIWERVYRAIIIVGIALVAIAFPSITGLMGLIGGLCITNMGFTYPAIIELCIIWHKPGLGPGRIMLWKNIGSIIIGVILCLSSSYFNAMSLFFSKNVS